LDDPSSNVRIGRATRRRCGPRPVLLVLAVQAALADTISIETGENLKYQYQGFQRMLAHSPQEFDEFNGPRCHGYVQGITDALNGQAFCLPPLSMLDHVLSSY
jgi:hypothetical protein